MIFKSLEILILTKVFVYYYQVVPTVHSTQKAFRSNKIAGMSGMGSSVKGLKGMKSLRSLVTPLFLFDFILTLHILEILTGNKKGSF